MKKNISGIVISIVFILIFHSKSYTQNIVNQEYKNNKLETSKRVEILLKQMTLEEKIGEMTQLCASSITLDGTKKLDLNLDKIREYILKYHVGSFLSGTGKAEKWVDFIKGIQEVAMKETRLGIPILFGMDNVHGSNYTDEATMLPHNLNLGCTFNPELAKEAAKITALESADLGHIWNFAPVLDVGKNPYWPRLYETFGEDPLVCGTMGSAFISSFQNSPEVAPYKLAACAKHFIGYSDPKSGWDRTPSEIPDQMLFETFVPPFEMAFKAGVKTLMVNSGELNGEPVHGSKKILKELLRDKLRFEGVVLTDIKDIFKMVEMHGAFANEEDATLAAIEAGIDMSMACSNVQFCDILKKLVQSGKVSELRIDESVRRILWLKFDLGLFENPYPRKNNLNKVGSPVHYQKALEAARQSIVMLKNDGNVLPLSSEKKNILVAGIGANSRKMMNGAWTLEWLGAEEERQPKMTKTLLEALKSQFPGNLISFQDSVGFASSDPKRFLKQWQEKASQADVLILAIGEKPYSEFKGNFSDLKIDAFQEEWIQAARQLNKPLVIIMLAGRPRILPETKGNKEAFLFAGHPGTAGAEALAEIVSGKYNPSGKLCFTYPKNPGHFTPYNHKKSEKYECAFPFGFGLNFGKVEVQNLTVSDTLIEVNGKFTLSFSLKNTGPLKLNETVLVFNQDEVGRITRPVQQLLHFQKTVLEVNQTKTISISLEAKSLCSFPDEKGQLIFEPGFHTLTVGNQKVRVRVK
jgi:beta-glucosidase